MERLTLGYRGVLLMVGDVLSVDISRHRRYSTHRRYVMAYASTYHIK